MSNGSIFLAKKMCTDSLEALKAPGDLYVFENLDAGVRGAGEVRGAVVPISLQVHYAPDTCPI